MLVGRLLRSGIAESRRFQTFGYSADSGVGEVWHCIVGDAEGYSVGSDKPEILTERDVKNMVFNCVENHFLKGFIHLIAEIFRVTSVILYESLSLIVTRAFTSTEGLC